VADTKDVRPHFYLGSTGKAEPFTSTSRGGRRPDVPTRNRQQHGGALIGQLLQVKERQAALHEEAEAYELESIVGIQVQFESFPNVQLAVESLADARQKVELVNVIKGDDKTFATIFVPEGKLSAIESKLHAYLEEKTDKAGRARDNRTLVDAIEAFRTAALEALWTDDRDQLPENPEETFWWEVWLPVRRDRQAVIHDFKRLAEASEILVSQQVLEFPERSVLLAQHTRVFSMALSATDTRDRGRPSAWSAAVDSLAVDYLGENQTPRLFTLSTGNSGDCLTDMADYPNYNLLQDIHDPGQAWNALTVGAYTAKVNITDMLPVPQRHWVGGSRR